MFFGILAASPEPLGEGGVDLRLRPIAHPRRSIANRDVREEDGDNEEEGEPDLGEPDLRHAAGHSGSAPSAEAGTGCAERSAALMSVMIVRASQEANRRTTLARAAPSSASLDFAELSEVQ